VVAARLAILLGCLHYDLGEREEAEAAAGLRVEDARPARARH
jgi:hypothetical protein